VIIIFELTGNYTIILPLMATIALATGVSSLLSRDTIYTLKLRRRGIDLLRGAAVNLMGGYVNPPRPPCCDVRWNSPVEYHHVVAWLA
jgi:hypothetical protein